MPSVLFVCTANRFRSPLASAFFRKVLHLSAMPGQWDVDSAGTWALPNLPVLPAVSLIAHKYELDLVRHRSKPVTNTVLAAKDLILVMEAGHKEALQHEFPSVREHIHLLSQVVEDRTYDIPDLTDTLEAIAEISGELNDLIQKGFINICELAFRLEGRGDGPGLSKD
jgi:protein-tyrosine-phosphatase